MKTIFKTPIDKQGIYIPKALLEQAGLGTEVELDIQINQIVIRPVHLNRHNWDQQFSAMAAQGDDRLLDEVTSINWDKEDWEWIHSEVAPEC